MSYRQQTGRKGTGRQISKATREKKTKEKKQKQTAKYLQEETPEVSAKEVAERALAGVNRLGNQIFALSPFSQYFDDWLVNLKQTISEFETNPAITTDEQFQKDSEQVFADVEAALAEDRLAESTLTQEAKALEENNHKIADADKEYAETTRELSNKRNSEIQKLTSDVRELEDDLAAQQDVKFGFFKFKEKRVASEKLAQTKKDLTLAKNKLEVTIESFKAEQDKLHDNYETQKQELFDVSDRLHKQLEKLETDTSTQARQSACNALAQAINALMQRTSPPAPEPPT
jgi:DNA repair exonuclease SbcCD ATPase subunit